MTTHALTVPAFASNPSSGTRQSSLSLRLVWTGRVLSGIATAFLAFDAIVKISQSPVAMEGTAKLGYPTSAVLVLGILQAICLALYLVPRTSIIGAVLWTGYLGGAVSAHVRIEDPLFSHVLAPVYVAVLLWGGLYLRNPRLRALLAR
jgi:hypothetical protein